MFKFRYDSAGLIEFSPERVWFSEKNKQDYEHWCY